LIIVAALSLAAYGQSSAPNGHPASGVALPRNVVVPINVVQRFFPDITQEVSTGENAAAVGAPKATRLVIYANSNRSKKVTISVDQYASSSEASAAFQEAVEKSRTVPGFKPLSVPVVGEQIMAGIVTQGTETHVGIGALDGSLIVGATLAGYEATPDNTNSLVALIRNEDASAKKVLAGKRSR
jgi:hypothetical protein